MPDTAELTRALVARKFLDRIREVADEFRGEDGGDVIDDVLPHIESAITETVPEASDT